MSKNLENSKRIAKNTVMLYFRQFITMVVSLYTSRVVLSTLGVEDYGVYNVVGGLVGMFSILSGSLSSAISRYITYELGKGNKERLKIIFSTSLNVQIIISVIVVLILEMVGVWFLNNKLDIPIDRLDAANAVLHISMLTFLVNLLSVPYNASIIAHEKMSAFAYVSLLEVFLKLGVVYILYIATFDKLIIYAWLLFGVALIIRAVYSIYCRRHFEECKYRFIMDKPLLKEMFIFAGWNFIGSSSGVLKEQGVNVVLNMFFGAPINAARGLAMQVNIVVTSFAINFMTAVNPQITKSYASSDRSYMIHLIYRSSRYGFYLLFLLAMPIILETPQILSLWLVETPDHTVNFIRLVFIYSLSQSFSYPLYTAMMATGKIRNYQIIVGGCEIMTLPLSYLVLKLGFPAESTMVVAIFISQCCLFARLFMLREMINLRAREFFTKIVLRAIIVAFVALIIPLTISMTLNQNFIRLVAVVGISVVSTIVTIYMFGIDSNERSFIEQKIADFLIKVNLKK